MTKSEKIAFISSLSHIFCCGIPLIASLVGVAGVSGVHAFHDALHDYEPYIVCFSVFFTVLAWVMRFATKEKHKKTHGCDHTHCEEKNRVSDKFLIIVTLITLVNLAFISMEWVH